jgi:sporulation protein YlmC with PRC-barrel domain
MNIILNRVLRAAAVAVCVGLSTSVLAQNSITSGARPLPIQQRDELDMQASKLTGATVVSPEGEKLGRVEDLVLDLTNAQTRYTVLNSDKTWSLNNKPVALPLNAFRFPTRPDVDIILLMDRDTVAKSHPFEEEALRQGGSAQRSSGGTEAQGNGNTGR